MPNSPFTKEQTMTDYRSGDARPVRPATSAGFVRPLLWLVLVLALACDVVISSMHVNILVELPVGLVGFSCIVGLVANYYRRQRR